MRGVATLGVFRGVVTDVGFLLEDLGVGVETLVAEVFFGATVRLLKFVLTEACAFAAEGVGSSPSSGCVRREAALEAARGVVKPPSVEEVCRDCVVLAAKDERVGVVGVEMPLALVFVAPVVMRGL